MSVYIRKDPLVVSRVIDIVLQEYRRSNSPQDWCGRLERVGYALRDTPAGPVVETLPHRVAICTLPPLPARVPAGRGSASA